VSHVRFGILSTGGCRLRGQLRPPIYFGAVTRGTRGLAWTFGLLLTALVVSSCGIGGLSPIFPTPVSPNGQDIYNTYIGISIPAIIIFVGIEIALLWVVLKYRRSRQPVGHVPPQIHGNTRLEIAWTVVPLIVVLAIALYSFQELLQDFQPVSASNYTVLISGHQFGWDYSYPEGFTIHQEGSLTTDVTPFVVPTGRLIRLQFRGSDVIHSWWVPAISGKTDAVPGYDNFSWLKIDQTGTWHGECAELCGVGHATMQIIVKAVDPTTFDSWVQQQLAAANASPSASPST
jgi:cytochrome c oxidase subunit 2